MRLKIFIGCLMLISCIACTPDKGEKIQIQNGGFEKNNGNEPLSWTTHCWNSDSNAVFFGISNTEAHTGAFSAVIENFTENHSRFIQSLQVQPGAAYELTGWIKAEGMDNAACGASLGIDEVVEISKLVRESHGRWEKITLYLRIDKDVTNIRVLLNLGNFSCLVTGKAYFDDIQIKKIALLPLTGADITITKKAIELPSVDEVKRNKIKSIQLPFLLFSAFFVAVALVLIVYLIIKRPKKVIIPVSLEMPEILRAWTVRKE